MQARSLQTTWTNLSKLAASLEAWSRDSFGAPRKEIKTLEKCLSRLRNTSDIRSYSSEEKDIEKKGSMSFLRERKSWHDSVQEWIGSKKGIGTLPFSMHVPQPGGEQIK
jgi:hypothetical protein